MPSEKAHVEFANRTQQTIASLLKADRNVHSPWVAISAFYKAVHVVEAVFCCDQSGPCHSSSHTDREAILRSRKKYKAINKHYAPLKRASLNARYLANGDIFDRYLTPQEVVDELLRHRLHQVEKSAKNFLKVPNDLTSILELLT